MRGSKADDQFCYAASMQLPPLLPAISSASRRQVVAETLRQAIISGVLQPGQRLTESALAEQLGTSRAPVREALRQLEQEGLVVSHAYRGTEVLGVSQDEIDNVLVPVRMTLEQFAFEKAMPRLSDEDYAHLESLVSSMDDAARHRDLQELADFDVRFHEFIMQRSEQPHCVQIWRSIQPRVRAYFHRDAAFYRDASSVARQHRRLLLALRSNDRDLLRDAVAAHISTYFTDDRDPADAGDSSSTA